MLVYVDKSPNCDTRSAKGNVSFKEFSKATDMHRRDVKNMMNELAKMLMEIGDNHDYTKKEKEDLFYKEFTESRKNGTKFTDGEWYKYHVENERHHLNQRVPEDVNLLDVLEFISDCSCAGMARSGEIYDITLPTSVLKKAFENTCKLVKDKIVITD